jgi:uridine kinase
MSTLNQLVEQITTQWSIGPKDRSLLVGISGIDGCGKGYVAAQLEAHLAQRAISSVVINLDGWLNLPQKRFATEAPAENFYQHAIRFEEFFSKLVVPLRDHRSIHLVADFAEETATQYRPHVYDVRNVDAVVVEGIFLFKNEYRDIFDLKVWLDCSFATALVRAIERSQEGLSPAQTIAAYETIYFPAQRIHFERDDPRTAADLIYNNDLYRPRSLPFLIGNTRATYSNQGH